MNECDILFEKMQKDDEIELKKRRKIIAKRIAVTLVLIAGISAIIIACKKNGDKKAANNISNLQKGLVREVKSIKPNEIKNENDADICEKKLDGIENITKKVKKYGYHEYEYKHFTDEDWEKYKLETHKRAKQAYKDLLELKSKIEEDNKLYKQMGIPGMQWLNPYIDDTIKKIRRRTRKI